MSGGTCSTCVGPPSSPTSSPCARRGSRTRPSDYPVGALERDHYIVERASVDQAEAHLDLVRARHLSDALAHALASIPGEDRERLEAQVDLSNRVLTALRGTAARAELAARAIVAPAPPGCSPCAPRMGGIAAHIGSSNPSSAAILDGLEWNVRVSRAEQARMTDAFRVADEG